MFSFEPKIPSDKWIVFLLFSFFVFSSGLLWNQTDIFIWCLLSRDWKDCDFIKCSILLFYHLFWLIFLMQKWFLIIQKGVKMVENERRYFQFWFTKKPKILDVGVSIREIIRENVDMKKSNNTILPKRKMWNNKEWVENRTRQKRCFLTKMSWKTRNSIDFFIYRICL